jgi:hypothetical protein
MRELSGSAFFREKPLTRRRLPAANIASIRLCGISITPDPSEVKNHRSRAGHFKNP